MWTTQRHDRRTRRQAQFQLECLDDRLVLSAAGGAGASIAHLGAMEHRLETRLARLEAKNGDLVTPAMARIQTRLARIQARMNVSVAATSGGSSGPGFQMTTFSTGSNTGGSASTTTDATTTPNPTNPPGHLPGHLLPGPNGRPVAIVFGAVSASSGSASTPSTGSTGGSASTPSTSDSGGSTSTTTDATTTSNPTTPPGHLPGHLLLGPNGQPVAVVH